MSEFLFLKAGGPHHERKTLQKNLGFSTRLPAPADRFAACLRGYGAETVGHAQALHLQRPELRRDSAGQYDDIMDMEQKIHRELCELVVLKKKITESLEKVENREERLLLTYRYLDNRTWEQIASMLSVSDRTVHRIHASALRNFSVPD